MGILTEMEKRLDAEGTIRIGLNYQATQIPDPIIPIPDNTDTNTKCIWDPTYVYMYLYFLCHL